MNTSELEEAARETYSRTEEWVNAVTHGAGAALSLAGLVYLLIAVYTEGPLRIAALAAYGASLIFLYTSSTLYHAWPDNPVKRFFQRMDHAAIFVLIAGSYTPFTLVTLEPEWGWPLFAVVWATALLGVVLKFMDVDTNRWIDVGMYLALGWISVVVLPQLFWSLPGVALGLLVAGGITYSAGTIFYLWDDVPLNHAIWHLFVLGGSAFHFGAVVTSVG